jgi:2-polyprenyl-6-methoxyphenol hydroxylase-like FAD-dependent oxidoreductase
MIKPLNIAIVGGGMGGLAAAIALLKCGFKVQIYERAKALQPIEAGLMLTPKFTIAVPYRIIAPIYSIAKRHKGFGPV